jgi:hypothetical protein
MYLKEKYSSPIPARGMVDTTLGSPSLNTLNAYHIDQPAPSVEYLKYFFILAAGLPLSSISSVNDSTETTSCTGSTVEYTLKLPEPDNTPSSPMFKLMESLDKRAGFIVIYQTF